MTAVTAPNCNCPPPPPVNCGPTWHVNSLDAAKGTASINLDNGYKLEINEHSSQIKIINTNCNETTTIWGDPHVDWNGKPGDEGRFFGNTTFQLADGTKITVNTVPWNAAKTEWLAENVVVTKGNQSLVIDGVAQIAKGDLKVYQGLNGAALDKLVGDGKLTVFENANGIGWVTSKGGNKIATQADFDKTIVKPGEANTHDLNKQLATLFNCGSKPQPPVCPPVIKPPVIKPPVCPPVVTPPSVPFNQQVVQDATGLYKMPAGTHSATIDFSVLGGEAGYRNSVGYYITDASGKIVKQELLFNDAKTLPKGSVTVPLQPGQSIGLYLVPNGGSGHPASAPLYSEAARNPNHFDQLRDNGTSLHWEDLIGGGDRDFNDVKMNVTIRAQGSTPACHPTPPVVHPPVCPPEPPHCPPVKCQSWLEALGSLWGKKLDAQADKIKDLANKLQNCKPDEKPSVTAELTVAAQQFQLLSQQSSTMMNALGQGLTTISRAG